MFRAIVDQRGPVIVGAIIRFVSLFILIFSLPVIAAEWTSSGGLRVGQVYNDNAGLSDGNERDEWSTVVSHNIDLRGKGARANIDLKAALEYNTLDGDADSLNPQLDADADVELVEDFFFIEAEANARQVAIDPFRASGATNLNQNDNRTTTYDYSVSPYITHRVGNFAALELRYLYDVQASRGNDLDDSTQEAVTLSLNSGSDFGRFSWGLFGRASETDFDDEVGAVSPTQDSDNEFRSATVRLGYRVSRKWQLRSSFGREWNDFISNGDIDDTRWDVGIIWTPTPRTNLNIGFGERFFGNTPAIEFSHSHKRSTIELNYSRELTDARSRRQSGDIFSSTNFFGQSANPFLRDLLNRSRNFTAADNSTFINEQFDFSYSIEGKRTTVTFDVDRSKQIAQDSSREAIFSGYSISVDRDLSGKLSMDFRYTRDRSEDRSPLSPAGTATSNRYDLSLRRELGPNTDIALNYNYTTRDSDLSGDDFSGNRISLFLSTRF